METVPLSQSFKDDRMTTWRFLRHSMQFSEHFSSENGCFYEKSNDRYLHITSVIFLNRHFVLFSCMSREETPTVEFLAAHA